MQTLRIPSMVRPERTFSSFELAELLLNFSSFADSVTQIVELASANFTGSDEFNTVNVR